MRRLVCALVVVSLLPAVDGEQLFGAVTVRHPSSGFGGYGSASSSRLTDAFDAATGNEVTVVANVADLNSLMSFDGLWLDHIDTDNDPDSSSQYLTPVEISNIEAFIALGRRVVMIGEGWPWENWNRQILDIAGGTLSDITASATMTRAVEHELTASAETIHVYGSGFSMGGTHLYEGWPNGTSIATLWGENVLTVMDDFITTDSGWSRADNAQFATNVVNWVSETQVVPEPSSIAIWSIVGVVGFVAMTRRRR